MGRLDHVKLRLVETFEEARAFEDWFVSGPQQTGIIGVDTETTGLSIEKDHVRLVQVGDLNYGWAMQWDRWSGLFQDIMTRYSGPMNLHNAPFDYAMLDKMGVRLDTSRIKDTLVMAHLAEPHLPHGLKSQAARHVDKRAGMAQGELGMGAAKWTWATVPINYGPYWQYGALDPVLTCHLADIHKEQMLLPAFDVENNVRWVLNDMMRRGLVVDVEYAREKAQVLREYCDQLAQWCRDNYGVRVGSNVGIIKALEEEGFTFSKLTQSGAVSLDKEVLAEVDHPLAEVVSKHRKIQKISSTYLDHFINENINGRIHPSINSLGARTSRMSSSKPNGQNLPRTAENNPYANIVRNCITSSPGHTLVFCDFDQVEMRGLAHFSGDPGLIRAFHSPDDFFVSLARTVFQDDTITKKHPYRQLVKGVGYGKIYGAGVEKLALTAKVPFQQAQHANDMFDTSFPGVKVFQQALFAEAAKNKKETGVPFVTCPFSGRKHVADPGKEYALLNYLIQGWAAFLFKTRLLELSNTDCADWMVLPVHDEIILDVPDARVHDCVEILRDVMNDAKTFKVPISAGIATGKRWGEKKEYEFS